MTGPRPRGARPLPVLVAVLVLVGVLAGCDGSSDETAGAPEASTAATGASSRATGDRTAPRPSPSATPPAASARLRYAFPIRGCEVSYATVHHHYPAVDMFAERGCLFVAPVSGRVDEVTRVDTWSAAVNDGATRSGRSVSLVGDDGVRYYGSHLEAVLDGVRPGRRVTAGTPLGRIGDSGSAAGTGTHLHFGISWPTPPEHWWIRRGTVAPQRYLDAWREGRQASPAQEVRRAQRRFGDDSECRTYC
ncbi:M23 family metallopeptidase [Nocardioides ferulae]|uniref:M23 family metallopeptidase n=1 Tax=Nocardioides ferulae TaxID=2340821 RepID=UPI00197DF568|nr:M23 family metallopeptidase [Nocardioides ferulae]